jgi:hypothetical protein
MKHRKRNGAIVEDDTEGSIPWGWVVCTDSFLSGWGSAPARSLYALAVADARQANIVAHNARARSDMKRVRFMRNVRSMRLKAGDHLRMVGPEQASRWYEEGGFR